MGENSGIEWTTHTFNPWIGCTKVSEACRFCYAELLMDTRYGKVQWGPNGTRVMTSPANWRKPLKWDREAKAAGERHRVFCASLADVFEDWDGPVRDHKGGDIWQAPNGDRPAYKTLSPPQYENLTRKGYRNLRLDDLRADLFRLIDATPNLDWLLLTKRPERILECWPERCGTGCECECHEVPPPNRHIPCQAGGCWERPNAWLGTSVEDRSQLHRIDELRRCRDLAPVQFLSCEPLLADLGKIDLTGIDWVIAGGESGPNARPSHPMWFRSLRNQCVQAGVPFFFKQNGEWWPQDEELNAFWIANEQPLSGGIWRWVYPDGTVSETIQTGRPGGWAVRRVGNKAAGRMLDGREWGQFPEVVA